jgi:bifunctional DNA-binding transcriptional regulator/antitoxin component of YhaV-PrlF toxin-antitoxin module
MTSLTITAKGQVTFKRDLMRHLGIRPGQRVEVEKLSRNELRLRAAQPKGSIKDFIHILDGIPRPKAGKPLTIDKMNEIIAAGWAGELREE